MNTYMVELSEGEARALVKTIGIALTNLSLKMSRSTGSTRAAAAADCEALQGAQQALLQEMKAGI